MKDGSLYNTSLKLLKIVDKDNYGIVIYEAVIHVVYAILTGMFEDKVEYSIFYGTRKKIKPLIF